MSKKDASGPAFPVGIDRGITKREQIAAMALQGMMADPERDMYPHEFAEYAVKLADALLDELDK